MTTLNVVYLQYWVADLTIAEKTFFLTLACWKWLFVTLIKLDWTKMFLHFFQLTCLTYSLVISRWPCCIILKQPWRKPVQSPNDALMQNLHICCFQFSIWPGHCQMARHGALLCKCIANNQILEVQRFCRDFLDCKFIFTYHIKM